MNKHFYIELQKIAGVGWDLHGYHRDPTMSAEDLAKGDEYYERKEQKLKPLGKKPKMKSHGWFSRTFLGRPNKETQLKSVKDWDSKRKQLLKGFGPAPIDDWEYRGASRIKTPFDSKTNYKLNSNMDYNVGDIGSLEDFTTDQAYSNKDRIRNISKSELKKIVKMYKKKLDVYKGDNPKDPYISPGGEAFIQKAQSLLEDPSFKFARLEYE